MIIVEGPDGAGKSTLVRWVCETYGLEEGQRGEKNRDLIYRTTRADTFSAIHNMFSAVEPPLVWDRLGPWSDPIYAPLMGRDTAFTPREIKAIRAMRYFLHVPIILCLPPLSVVRANVEGSHQIKAATDHIDVIYRAYRDGMIYTLLHDYTQDNIDPVAGLIESYLHNRKERECFSS